jgi:hypothetical protein
MTATRFAFRRSGVDPVMTVELQDNGMQATPAHTARRFVSYDAVALAT